VQSVISFFSGKSCFIYVLFLLIAEVTRKTERRHSHGGVAFEVKFGDENTNLRAQRRPPKLKVNKWQNEGMNEWTSEWMNESEI